MTSSRVGHLPGPPGIEHTSLRGAKRVLLVNPPVADTIDPHERNMVTCVQPFGLLRLATWFRERGVEVEWVDCLRDPSLGGCVKGHLRKTLDCGADGEAPTRKEIFHYGLDAERLAARLKTVPSPDVIGVSAVFTWHMEAAREAIAVCRQAFPSARLLLGGNAAILCPEQARALGADDVVSGDLPGAEFLPTAIDLCPGAATTDFVSMVRGCPHRCEYCVTPVLTGGRVLTRSPERVLEEMVAKIAAHGIRRFVVYDDFVQYKQAAFLDRLLDLVVERHLEVRLEFALGFVARQVTEEFALRLRRAGVEDVVLALETTSESRTQEMKRPQRVDDFTRAVRVLQQKGYTGRHLRAFYLVGLPGQTTREILAAIAFLYRLGVTPSLTTYALTPRSGDWSRYAPLVEGRALDELSPYLWRFAHPEMKVRELDAIYRHFHERCHPPAPSLTSKTDDPVVVELCRILHEDLRRSG